MKTPLSQKQPYLALIFILLSMYGCTPAIGPMSQTDPDDESGIGGTGMLAQTGHHEAIAVIGAITGFGSIFINGLEIDIPQQTEVAADGKTIHQPDFAIGDVLEVLAVPGKNMYEALHISIHHEVIGPVSKVNSEERSFEIMEQVIFMANLREPLPKIGQVLKISGFRDDQKRIHASRLTKSDSSTVSLTGRITKREGSSVMIGTMKVVAEHVPTVAIDGLVTTVGELRNGTLFAKSVRPKPALPFADQASRWLVQGFLKQHAPHQLTIGGITTSASDQVKVHQRLAGSAATLSRVEITYSPASGRPPAIVAILDDYALATGRRTAPEPHGHLPTPAPAHNTTTPQIPAIHPRRIPPLIIHR